MRARTVLALLCSVVAISAVSGCSSKQPDAKEQAAKLDRSKIDDEVANPPAAGGANQQQNNNSGNSRE